MKNQKKHQRVNDRIRATRVRLVLANGEMKGEMSFSDARRLASESGLDLVEVEPGQTPVCRLMDYGKIKYNQSKKQKSLSKSQVKEVRVGFNTDDRDLEIKHRKVRKFLGKRAKVKYALRLKGRQRAFAREALERFQDQLEQFVDIAKWDPPRQSGSVISVILTPK